MRPHSRKSATSQRDVSECQSNDVDVDVPLAQEVKLFVENIDRRIIVSTELIFLGLKMGTSYLTITQTATKVLCLLLFLSLTVV